MPPDPWDVGRIESLAPDEASVKAARKLLKERRFSAIQRRADGCGVWAKCRGLTDDYEVTAAPPGGGAVATSCTCPSPKRPCKHALALLMYLAAHPDERPGRPDADADTPIGGAGFEGLLSACFAEPDSDTPRLVLADYLEERGQAERARLLRLQLERARAPKPPGRRSRGLPKAEVELLAPVLGALPDWAQDQLRAVRGFLHLDLTGDCGEPDDWPESLARLFAQGWVERLSYRYTLQPTAALARLAAQVGEVVLPPTQGWAAYLADSAAVLGPVVGTGRLHRVVAGEGDKRLWARLLAEPVAITTDPQLAPPTSSHYFDATPGLVRARAARGHLVLEGEVAFFGHLSPETAAEFAGHPDAGRCESLTLRDLHLSAGAAASLAQSPNLSGVRSLTLRDVAWNAGAADTLLESPLVGRLTNLTLGAEPLTDTYFATIGRAAPDRLAHFQLGGGEWTIPGLAALLRRLPALERCHLQRTLEPAEFLRLRLILTGRPAELTWASGPFDGHQTARLAARPGGKSGLDLTGVYHRIWSPECARLDYSGVAAFALSGVGDPSPAFFADLAECFPDGLAELSATRCRLRTRHAAALADALPVLRPRLLNLSGNELGVASLRLLLASPGLSELAEFDLGFNPLQPTALDALLAWPHLTSLTRLRLPGAAGAVQAKFRRAAPTTLTVEWAR